MRLLIFWFLLSIPRISYAASLTEVAPGVFRYRDTCDVYAIVRDGKAVLIDFGSGGILKHLEDIGAKQVDWILHTHFHRDQNQGDLLARSRGIRIAAPESERKYLEAAEQMWQEKKVFHLYDMRNEFFAPRENIPVDRGLEPGTTFDWEGLQIRVVASPGHTEGSVSYLLEREGKTLAFCGDLVASPGKIQTIVRGIAAQIGSLNMMRQYAPAMLLPSHGGKSYRRGHRYYKWEQTEIAHIYIRSCCHGSPLIAQA